MERWVDGKLLYEGRVVSLRVGNVELDDGTIALREVVVHPGGVAVVPVKDDKVILVRQFRIAIGEDVLELPAGKLEKGEDPEARGRAELEEETGFRAGRMISAGSIYATVGYSSEIIYLYFAFDLEHIGQNMEFDERIDIVELPVSEIAARIADGTIRDAKTIIGLQSLVRYLATEHTCGGH
ncbi:MAG TPA: NUDIX hydrolase [Candidatus Hydrogenedentes bacterium]|nr:NUDIX hydrolase [Candidatus Hydrogenedentota bacterium]HPC18395.1 NUDIX hydrolase [Candidatus Hydrogenedentota bacterium]HRT21068.1 NUDIX hydrolase [Candidatus Hydrogenedentota bacterium]HRT66059.1 NUDIX hydrolase [Candidatus Hydrogenedentota bacterium]